MIIFFNLCFNKRRLKQLISWFFYSYGPHGTLQLLESIKQVGFHQATLAGVSIGIEDLQSPVSKPVLFQNIEQNARQSRREMFQGTMIHTERVGQLLNTWNDTSERLKQLVVDNFRGVDMTNPVYMMAFSGARGSVAQIRQLAGMRGLMADPQGEILDFPIRSNFREGLSLTEYVISCYGARKGIVDTALRTATSGYLTRRLVDVAQHVVIGRRNCFTTKGIWLSNLYEGSKKLLSVEQRIIGRIFLHSSPRPQGDFHGFEITPSLATTLASKSHKICVRSPLTCSMAGSLCQLCYGWNLANGRLVALGEAVGVLAAQSIGEPGTQLTMRTFHTGGVFSGSIDEQKRSPVCGKIHYQTQFAGCLARTKQGRIGFLAKNPGRLEIIAFRPKGYRVRFGVEPQMLLFIREGGSIQARQQIALLGSTFGSITVEREQNFIAPVSGQLFFQRLKVIEQRTRLGQARMFGHQLGCAWILHTHCFLKAHSHRLFPKNLDLIDFHTRLQRFQVYWFEPTRSLYQDIKIYNGRSSGFRSVNNLAEPSAPFSYSALQSYLNRFELHNSITLFFNFHYCWFSLTTQLFLVFLPRRVVSTKLINQPIQWFNESRQFKIGLPSIVIPGSFIHLNTFNFLKHRIISLKPFLKKSRFYKYWKKAGPSKLIWVDSQGFNPLIEKKRLQVGTVPKNRLTLPFFKIHKPLFMNFFAPNYSSQLKRYFIFQPFPNEKIFQNTHCRSLIFSRGWQTWICHRPVKWKLNMKCWNGEWGFWTIAKKTQNFKKAFLNKRFQLTTIHCKSFDSEFFQALSLHGCSRIELTFKLFGAPANLLRSSRQGQNQSERANRFIALEINSLKRPGSSSLGLTALGLRTHILTNPPFFRYDSSELVKPVCRSRDKPSKQVRTNLSYFQFSKLPLFNQPIQHPYPYQRQGLINCQGLWFGGFQPFVKNREIKYLQFIQQNVWSRRHHWPWPMPAWMTPLSFQRSPQPQAWGWRKVVQPNSLYFEYSNQQIHGEFTQSSKFSSYAILEINKCVCFWGRFFNKHLVGSLAKRGQTFIKNRICSVSGQIFQRSPKTLMIQPATGVLFARRGIVHLKPNTYILQGTRLFTSFDRQLKTGDIIQGIPRIEECFEARQTRGGEPLANHWPGRMDFLIDRILLSTQSKLSVSSALSRAVLQLQHEILETLQRVYCAQGVYIADKHFEIIIQQMTLRARIVDGSTTGLLCGELIPIRWIERYNSFLRATPKYKLKQPPRFFKQRPITYRPTILGITRTCLETDSFISAASFQETTRVLSRAAIEGKIDFIRGLKENVILGHLIPSGTGFL